MKSFRGKPASAHLLAESQYTFVYFELFLVYRTDLYLECHLICLLLLVVFRGLLVWKWRDYFCHNILSVFSRMGFDFVILIEESFAKLAFTIGSSLLSFALMRWLQVWCGASYP